MKTVNVDDILKILHEYGRFVFVTDSERYSEMVDKISNLPGHYGTPLDSVLDEIRAKIGQLPSELTADGRRMIRRVRVYDILDEYKAGSEAGE